MMDSWQVKETLHLTSDGKYAPCWPLQYYHPFVLADQPQKFNIVKDLKTKWKHWPKKLLTEL